MSSNKLTALIGATGLVGGHLRKQYNFDYLINSTNWNSLNSTDLDFLVVAAARAEKWKANQNPKEDAAHIDQLMAHLQKIKADTAILISTVDVYAKPSLKVEADSPEIINHPYGFNRRRLEVFFAEHFKNSFIVRLPALFGEGLKKNIIFDFLNDNETHKIDSRAKFQFYNLLNLKTDLDKVLSHKIKILNLATEPLTVAEISQRGFAKLFKNELSAPVTSYDIKSQFAEIWGHHDGYLYSKAQTLEELKDFVHRYQKGRT
ncbi:MAG: hypothetical protein H7061_01180 [Bdellovibrionaceae bacterium]|nr:hypothetical protein [Bdellovibrio sp.]